MIPLLPSKIQLPSQHITPPPSPHSYPFPICSFPCRPPWAPSPQLLSSILLCRVRRYPCATYPHRLNVDFVFRVSCFSCFLCLSSRDSQNSRSSTKVTSGAAEESGRGTKARGERSSTTADRWRSFDLDGDGESGREGDWTCPECKMNNFAHRVRCYG